MNTSHMLNDADYIESIVYSFYTKAIKDFMIGYHFRKIQQSPSVHPLRPELGQFSHHIPRIINFWKVQLIEGFSEVEGAPFDLINVHKVLNPRKGEVNRWVVLFLETLQENESHPLKDPWAARVAQFQNIFLTKLF